MDIAEKYNVSAKINAKYTLTGNNRDATFSISSPDAPLDLSCVSSSTSAYVAAMYDCRVKIKRVRLVSAGAPGLQRTETHRAGSFVLALQAADENGIYTTLDSVIVKIDNWNEWTETNFELRPFKTQFTFTPAQITQHKPIKFCALFTNSGFYCDDFNVHSAYVGQTLTPWLEMEIETAGMVELQNYNII